MKLITIRELTGRNPREREYVLYWIKHPDPGSTFEKQTRYIRWLPGWIWFMLLRKWSYDGLIFYENETLIGHIFYQEHPREWRAFSIFVSPSLRQKGYAQKILREFLERAYNDSLTQGIKIGSGGHPVVEHLRKKALNGTLGLSIPMQAGTTPGAITFSRERVTPV